MKHHHLASSKTLHGAGVTAVLSGSKRRVSRLFQHPFAPTGLLLASIWGLVFYHIHLGWVANKVYSYGWAVPFLAAYLAWQRWESRPPAARTRSPIIVAILILLLLAAYLPIRIVHEANPDWVKVNWSLVGVGAAISFVMCWSAGGLRYAWHFAFPALFCFTAVPWPVWLETTLVQSLMSANAGICAEVLTLLGLPAIAQGNLIQIASTILNVEEACSGIRSLQTAFMMALFLGEFYRANLMRRAAILTAALAAAFVSNMLRTIVLAYFAAAGSLDRWHDLVGNVAMVVTLAAVWVIAEQFRPKSDTRMNPVAIASPPAALNCPRVFPAWLGVTGVFALLMSEFATEGWYQFHERNVPASTDWAMHSPGSARAFSQRPFHERSQALLKFSSGWTGTWLDATGYRWQAYFLRWKPGRVSKYLAMSHYPTVCLPATGLVAVGESGQWEWREGNIRLPFTSYIFNDNGRDVYVFHAIVEDRPLSHDARFSYYQVTSTERIASVLRGERNLGQKVLGIAIQGCASPLQARTLLQNALRTMIVPAAALPPSEAANSPRHDSPTMVRTVAQNAGATPPIDHATRSSRN